MANRTITSKLSAKKTTTATIGGESVTLRPTGTWGDTWAVTLPGWRGTDVADMELVDNGDDWTATLGARCFTGPTWEDAIELVRAHVEFLALRKL